jgi:hypothetical protein
MLTKNELLASMQHETNIIKHLAGKVPAGLLEHRPTPGQRSIWELMRYLTHCAILPAVGLVNGNWDHVGEMNAEADKQTPETFDAAMDQQMVALQELLDGFTEAELAEREGALPWGTPIRFGQGLVDMAVKSLTAYRMQLFLWVKEAGNPDLSTVNCWVGMDAMKPPGDAGG